MGCKPSRSVKAIPNMAGERTKRAPADNYRISTGSEIAAAAGATAGLSRQGPLEPFAPRPTGPTNPAVPTGPGELREQSPGGFPASGWVAGHPEASKPSRTR
ncbi:hypothetical protein PSCLAVI8L_170038 [Pseudoclavibacter sp. 8L]|nr:hypothetical protein PSCLAVI8L_170038 [Pseudoclavibacter sp. 8L]